MSKAKPLWIEKYRPSLSDIAQVEVRSRFQSAQHSPFNLFVFGPEGVGKTAAVDALLSETEKQQSQSVLRISAAEFFNMSKTEIASDSRFKSFLSGTTKRNLSKAGMLSHSLKESAGFTMPGTEHIIVIDDAGRMRRDLQHALRRIIEQHHHSTRFIIISRTTENIIPAIRSRCVPVPIPRPTSEELRTVFENICETESINIDEQPLQKLAEVSDGNIRRGIMILQTVTSGDGGITPTEIEETAVKYSTGEDIKSVLELAESGEISEARNQIDDLLIDDEFTGKEVLAQLTESIHYRYSEEDVLELMPAIADIDRNMETGTNPRTHLAQLLTTIHSQKPTTA